MKVIFIHMYSREMIFAWTKENGEIYLPEFENDYMNDNNIEDHNQPFTYKDESENDPRDPDDPETLVPRIKNMIVYFFVPA